ncbi:MAG: sigma-70 family RNA polymerase sigma factor [Myxococcota bacterium]
MPEPARLVDPLIAPAVGGDPSARAQLVRTHGPLVWTLCRRLGPDPEDAYQDVWAKIFAALPRFDPGGAASLRTWIATITHRHLVDRSRRRKVRGETVEFGDHPAHEPDLDRVGLLHAALARLPEAQRRVVVMHHLHDRGLDEVAADEGVPVGTVKSRLHRARARLLELLEGR